MLGTRLLPCTREIDCLIAHGAEVLLYTTQTGSKLLRERAQLAREAISGRQLVSKTHGLALLLLLFFHLLLALRYETVDKVFIPNFLGFFDQHLCQFLSFFS